MSEREYIAIVPHHWNRATTIPGAIEAVMRSSFIREPTKVMVYEVPEGTSVGPLGLGFSWPIPEGEEKPEPPVKLFSSSIHPHICNLCEGPASGLFESGVSNWPMVCAECLFEEVMEGKPEEGE